MSKVTVNEIRWQKVEDNGSEFIRVTVGSESRLFDPWNLGNIGAWLRMTVDMELSQSDYDALMAAIEADPKSGTFIVCSDAPKLTQSTIEAAIDAGPTLTDKKPFKSSTAAPKSKYRK